MLNMKIVPPEHYPFMILKKIEYAKMLMIQEIQWGEEIFIPKELS